jgi:predicted transcriptional regulator
MNFRSLRALAQGLKPNQLALLRLLQYHAEQPHF